MVSSNTEIGALLSAHELSKLMEGSDVVVLDATYYAASDKMNAKDEFECCHIPGARFFDIEAIARHDIDLPHMIPDVNDFERAAGNLGVSSDKHVVVYDRPRLRSAPRAWWMFRYFGHPHVSVLDGGLKAWQDAGFPLEAGSAPRPPTRFKGNVQVALLRSLEDAIKNVEEGHELYIDARPANRFCGIEGDSWTSLRGHIRGSVNIPSSSLITVDGQLKTSAELRDIFNPLLDGRKIVASCGSGIAAPIVALALYMIGQPDVAVFDGSWAEWGKDERTPFLTNSGSDREVA